MANGKTMQAVVNLAGSIDPSLGKAIEQAQKKISGLNVKALAVGAAVGGIAVATGKAVVEAGKYMKDLGASFDDAADAIRIGTGATGDALDGLLDDFDAVYKSVPTTMEDASKAIADYNTRLGLTGPQLQEISKQAIQVSDMLGDDLGSVIEESSQAFQQWNIDADDMGGAMDYIFKVSQSTGMGFTDLMADMQKFGPQLQEMGYSFETASALMGQLDKAGVNTDEVLGAMKKSVAALAKEGISASDGLAMYYEKIKNAGTAAEAASIASEIFGTRAGSTMAAAIRDGSLAVADLTAELQENGETIAGAADDTYDFAERLQVMKQGLEAYGEHCVRRAQQVHADPAKADGADNPGHLQGGRGCGPVCRRVPDRRGRRPRGRSATDLSARGRPSASSDAANEHSAPAASQPRADTPPTTHADRLRDPAAYCQPACHRAPYHHADRQRRAACAGEHHLEPAAGHHPAAGSGPANRQQRHHAAA